MADQKVVELVDLKVVSKVVLMVEMLAEKLVGQLAVLLLEHNLSTNLQKAAIKLDRNIVFCFKILTCCFVNNPLSEIFTAKLISRLKFYVCQF
jgi:hypothetical protein